MDMLLRCSKCGLQSNSVVFIDGNQYCSICAAEIRSIMNQNNQFNFQKELLEEVRRYNNIIGGEKTQLISLKTFQCDLESWIEQSQDKIFMISLKLDSGDYEEQGNYKITRAIVLPNNEIMLEVVYAYAEEVKNKVITKKLTISEVRDYYLLKDIIISDITDTEEYAFLKENSSAEE